MLLCRRIVLYPKKKDRIEKQDEPVTAPVWAEEKFEMFLPEGFEEEIRGNNNKEEN